MKIACLQFNPILGAVRQNIDRAEALLNAATLEGSMTILILPEMAFTGYNFPNFEAIQPFLEPTISGPTTEWARVAALRLKCHVVVGYPEIDRGTGRSYNSTVTISPGGVPVANYRKSYLYYTDETWASEGPNGSSRYHDADHKPFFCGQIDQLGKIGLGICMDINPYRFETPWTDYEFATTMLHNRVELVILSMAWLTRLLPEELQNQPQQPDMETVAYWLERFFPFTNRTSGEAINVVFANRCGVEGNIIYTPDGERPVTMTLETGQKIEMGDQICYAGSTCVMNFHAGGVSLYERKDGKAAILGKAEEGVLIVDTNQVSKLILQNLVLFADALL